MKNELKQLLGKLESNNKKVEQEILNNEKVYEAIAELYLKQNELNETEYKLSKSGKLQIVNTEYSSETIDLKKWLHSIIKDSYE